MKGTISSGEFVLNVKGIFDCEKVGKFLAYDEQMKWYANNSKLRPNVISKGNLFATDTEQLSHCLPARQIRKLRNNAVIIRGFTDWVPNASLIHKKMKMTLWKSTETGHQQFSWEPPIETESCFDDSITVLCPTKRVPDLSGPFYKIGGASIMPCPSFGTQSCSFHSNRWSKRTSKKPRPRGVPSCNTVLPSLADGQSYFARISWW